MYSLRKAIFLILLSIVFISGIPWGVFIAYSQILSFRMNDPRYEIKAIVQETSDTDPLKTNQLAEILELSWDHPTNLYQLDLGLAKQKLEAFPLIKEAHLRRGSPDFLYLTYSMRKPFAKLGKISNTVIDQEGMLFPFTPFFSPKNLPTFTLGKDIALKWGEKIPHEKLSLSFQVFEEIKKMHFFGEIEIEIDTSSAHALSLGEQKVIVILRERGQIHYLVLDPQEFKDGIKRYQMLKGKIHLNGMIDLRLPQLGFIKRN